MTEQYLTAQLIVFMLLMWIRLFEIEGNNESYFISEWDYVSI